jgi:hypothetical protein
MRAEFDVLLPDEAESDEPISLFPNSVVVGAPPSPDDLDSLAPTHRVAPARSVVPPSPRRRWRARPAWTEAMAGLGGFLVLVTAITAPVAAYAGQGLTLALLLAVALPSVAASVVLQRAGHGGRQLRAAVDMLARRVSLLATALAVGLSLGGVAWVVHTEAVHALAVLEPVLVASAYSLVTAIGGAFVGWRVRAFTP